jgi:hypothetical protein
VQKRVRAARLRRAALRDRRRAEDHRRVHAHHIGMARRTDTDYSCRGTCDPMTGCPVGRRPGRTARPTSVAFVVGMCALTLMSSVAVRAERLPIRSYGTSDGLAHDRVNRIVPDSRGFLWLCTAAGLSRFDGYTFLNLGSGHGLPSATVNDLLETRAGKYWIATDEGLVRFNPAGRPQNRLLQESDRDAALAMFAIVLPADQDRRARAMTIVREGRDGTIWVGTRRGLYRLDGGDGQHVLRAVDIALPSVFPGQREIVDLLEDSRGSIWVVTPVGLHRRWTDGSAAAYPLSPLRDLADVFEDRTGALWVASRANGIARLAVDAGLTPPRIEFTLSVPDGLPSSWVTHMYETSRTCTKPPMGGSGLELAAVLRNCSRFPIVTAAGSAPTRCATG